MLTALNKQLKDVSMKESLNGLSVDVGDKVTRSEPGVKGRRAPVHFHDQVMHSVKVRVPEVDSDGADGEAKTARAAPHDDWSLQRVDQRRKVPGWK